MSGWEEDARTARKPSAWTKPSSPIPERRRTSKKGLEWAGADRFHFSQAADSAGDCRVGGARLQAQAVHRRGAV